MFGFEASNYNIGSRARKWPVRMKYTGPLRLVSCRYAQKLWSQSGWLDVSRYAEAFDQNTATSDGHVVDLELEFEKDKESWALNFPTGIESSG